MIASRPHRCRREFRYSTWEPAGHTVSQWPPASFSRPNEAPVSRQNSPLAAILVRNRRQDHQVRHETDGVDSLVASRRIRDEKYAESIDQICIDMNFARRGCKVEKRSVDIQDPHSRDFRRLPALVVRLTPRLEGESSEARGRPGALRSTYLVVVVAEEA